MNGKRKQLLLERKVACAQPSRTPCGHNEIRTFFHHFTPLSNFTSLIDLDQNYTPYKYYKYYPPNNYDVIESYYLVNDNQTLAYGWVHNVNKYWSNSYIYDAYPNDENYYGCEREANVNFHAPATSFLIDGFAPHTSYLIEFYPTRMGTYSLPSSQGTTSDGNGSITIDLSSAPLGCDSTNTDYAFKVTIGPPLRLAHYGSEKNNDTDNSLNFSIFPNPANGQAKIVMPMDAGNELILRDVTGRIVKKISAPNQNNVPIDISSYSKGIYLVQLRNSSGEKVKRLIIH